MGDFSHIQWFLARKILFLEHQHQGDLDVEPNILPKHCDKVIV
jgi:hypothetical protein